MSSSTIDQAPMVEVTMPDGEGPGAEIEVIAWHKRPGEAIAEGEPICLLSVDGLHAEVASPADGTVARLAVGVGAYVSCGAILAEIAPPAPEPVAKPEPEPITPEPDPEPVEMALLSAYGVQTRPEPEIVDMARFRSPAVRRLLAAHGVDFDSIEGSGRGGRVTREDVLAAVVDPAGASVGP